ncbi:MAG: VCBS repeat-containing protein [Bryobacterales bacterium]|nr:VCBS repeat-containing protein [Bryobacterales bacterium]
MSIWAHAPGSNAGREAAFQYVVIDAAGPRDPWLKSAGDLNGDGRVDLIAGGHEGGGLVWYENPSWKKHVIAAEGEFSTDGEVADVNGDGHVDMVVVTSKELLWYEGPDWKPHHIDDVVLHDIEVADLDGDGRPDIVGRDQSAFGKHSGNTLHFYLQESPSCWKHLTMPIPNGEGLLVTDINRDRRPDVVIGRSWFENPGGDLSTTGTWPSHEYGGNWDYPHVYAAAGDINGDGRVDIALAPSERDGGKYRISWFEATADPRTTNWKEHVIEDEVETAHHFIGIADFNADGQTDVVTAAMHQAKSPQITLYLGANHGSQWTRQAVAQTGSHSMRVVDVDGNGLPSLFGANWEGVKVELWRNVTRIRRAAVPGVGMELWTYRTQLKADLPGTLGMIRALGFTDVETGSYYGRTAVEFRKLLDTAGLRCGGIFTEYERLKNNLPEVAAEARTLGARYVLVADIPYTGHFTAADARRAAADFNGWGKRLKSEGLQFAYHPHGFEFEPSARGTAFDILMTETDQGLVTYEVDTYHFLEGGADPVKYLKKYPGRFALAHLKDMAKGGPARLAAGTAGRETSVTLGSGMVSWQKFFAAAGKAGLQVYYVEDDSADAPTQVPATLKYLRQFGIVPNGGGK